MTSGMWDIFYEEEKRNLEDSLVNFVNSAQRDVEPFSSSRHSFSNNSEELAWKKQAVIDALIKIRGKVQLKHEESLKKQQEALIYAVDNAIRKEAEEMKIKFQQSAKHCITGAFFQELSRKLMVVEDSMLIARYCPSSSGHKPTKSDYNDVDNSINDIISKLHYIVDDYGERKRQKAAEAMKLELLSLCPARQQGNMTNQSMLQEELKRMMNESCAAEEKLWQSKMRNESPNANKTESVKSLLLLHKRNVQLAAQICVLKALNQKKNEVFS